MSGFVQDIQTGQPLAGVVVSIGNKSATTSKEGSFEIRGLEPGQKTWTATHERYRSFQSVVTITTTSQVQNIQLHPHPETALPALAPSHAEAALFRPAALTVDNNGTIFVSDTGHHRIIRISSDGILTILAGNGTEGFRDGLGAEARLNSPQGLAIDAQGNIYVADQLNHCIRKITPAGRVTTMAGKGQQGFSDGPGARAQFAFPTGIAADREGYLFVTDQLNHRIRKISPDGIVATLAGQETQGGVAAGAADGIGTQAFFYHPWGIALDSAGNLYVTETGSSRIRKVSAAGAVTTLGGNFYPGYTEGPGSGSRFNQPRGIAVDSQGNLLVADTGNHRIRKITPTGVVLNLAGSDPQGFGHGDYKDGPGSQARFNEPMGVTLAQDGSLYLADTQNHRVRKISPAGEVSTVL